MAIGLYIHVPFCIKKCQYCDFVSYPLEGKASSNYISSLFKEMSVYADKLKPDTKIIDSVYIGGGTPTCLSGDDLAGILDKIFSCFDVRDGAEITVEVNPGTVTREKLVSLKKAGVNRLSIGFQSCHPDLLHTLGRIHTFFEAVKTFREARALGYDNINIDLIFGIPGQSYEQWQSCLEKVVRLYPDHISAYNLQLEEGTPLFDMVNKGFLEPCSEDLEADMYQNLIEMLSVSGYVHYEISNFALRGRFCRHNLRYWQNRSFLGLGPAAHSFLDGRRFSNEPDVDRYMEKLMEGYLPVSWEKKLDVRTEMSETVFMGLRLIEGLDKDEFRKRFGEKVNEVFESEIERLIEMGLLKNLENRICLTAKGLMLGNIVFMQFV